MHIKAMLVLTIAVCAPALAVNMSFLKDAPITRLDSKELKAYNEFIGKTLSEGPDGVVAEWTAPKTPFKGKVTPAARFKEGARECREAAIESNSVDRHARGTYTFCQNDKGEWRIKGASSKAKR